MVIEIVGLQNEPLAQNLGRMVFDRYPDGRQLGFRCSNAVACTTWFARVPDVPEKASHASVETWITLLSQA